MKKLLLFLVLIPVVLFSLDVSGNQSGIWSLANSPYNIVGEVTIPLNETLEIEPGVEIVGSNDYRITALGHILANGTLSDSIRFYSTTSWGGIRLENEELTSEFSYCRISNTNDQNDNAINSINSPVSLMNSVIDQHVEGLNFFGIGDSNPANCSVVNVLVKDCEKSGINISDNKNVVINESEITRCAYGSQFRGAIQIQGQSAITDHTPSILNSSIHHNYKQGITATTIYNDVVVEPIIQGCSVRYNYTGVYFNNTSGIIKDSFINQNFVDGNMNSGAGVMVYGQNGNAVITNTEISENYAGLYIVNNASVNLGNLSNDLESDNGLNRFHNNIDANGNNNSIYANTDGELYAQNCFWDSEDVTLIAETITDAMDGSGTSSVIFDPLADLTDVTISGEISFENNISYLRVIVVDDEYNFVNTAEIEMNNQNSPVNYQVLVPQNGNYYVGAFAWENSSEIEFYGSYPELNSHELISVTDTNVLFIDFSISEENPDIDLSINQSEIIEGNEVFDIQLKQFLFPSFLTYRVYKDSDDYRLYSVMLFEEEGTEEQIFDEEYYWYKEGSFLTFDLQNDGFSEYNVEVEKVLVDSATASSSGEYNLHKYTSTETDSVYLKRSFKEGIGMNSMQFFINNYAIMNLNLKEVVQAEGDGFFPLAIGNRWIYTQEEPVKKPVNVSLDYDFSTQELIGIDLDLPSYFSEQTVVGYKLYLNQNFLGNLDLDFSPSYFELMGLAQIAVEYDNGEISELSDGIYLSYTSNDEEVSQSYKFKTSVYPNPFIKSNGRSVLQLVMNKPIKQNSKITIFNILGKRMKRIDVPRDHRGQTEFAIDLEDNYSSGIYFYKIENGRDISSGKFTIIK